MFGSFHILEEYKKLMQLADKNIYIFATLIQRNLLSFELKVTKIYEINLVDDQLNFECPCRMLERQCAHALCGTYGGANVCCRLLSA